MKEQNYLIRFFFPHTLKNACNAPNKCIVLISRYQTNFINMQIEAQYVNWWYILDFLWTNNKFNINVTCFMLIEYNHCLESVRIRSFSGRYFPIVRLYTDQKIVQIRTLLTQWMACNLSGFTIILFSRNHLMATLHSGSNFYFNPLTFVALCLNRYHLQSCELMQLNKQQKVVKKMS